MIRNTKESDIPEIIKIEKAVFPDPWDEQLFHDAACSKDKHFFVDSQNGIVQGYILFERVLDEGHITNLAVGKVYQRKGIATGLVKKILDLAKELDIRDLYLEVRRSNEPAKVLYDKFGFKEVGARKAYYHRTNEDALIYKLSL